LYSFDDLFMSQLKQTLGNIEKENPTKVHFTFYDGKNNISLQIETIDYICKNKIDLIIANLADISENSIKEVLNRVQPKEIPIIFLENSSEAISKISKNYKRVAFLTGNSFLAGFTEGNILVKLWNSNRKALDKNNDDILQYVILQGDINNPITINRTKYAILALNNAGIKTEQLASANNNWLKDFSRSSMDSIFFKYDDKIEAIIANNDAMAIGAIEALQKYGYNKGDTSKNIAVVGIDGVPEAEELIDKGLMTGTVIQDPNVLAKTLYDVGTDLVKGLNPTEDTNYSIISGSIIIPYPYSEYIKK
jgi:methyl-galactoside transport system substrate-binding protein